MVYDKDHWPRFVSLRDIAAWTPGTAACLVGESPLPVRLPPIQRGLVWNAWQIELLWDSLLRGFPIGAFMLSAPQSSKNSRTLKGVTRKSGVLTNEPEPFYSLLDGQQRAHAIALGFCTAHEFTSDAASTTLWIDLKKASGKSDRSYTFKVSTKTHPWGVQDEANKYLTRQHRSEALQSFRKVAGAYSKLPYTSIPLCYTCPWESALPVPLPCVIEALRANAGDAARALAQLPELMAEFIPYWSTLREEEFPAYYKWKTAMHTLCAGADTGGARHADAVNILAVLARCLDSTVYPLLTLPEVIADAVADASDEKDDIKSLFVRLNSAGTPLSGEEIVFSLFKSAFEEFAFTWEAATEQFTSPSRFVSLLIRLALARMQHQSYIQSGQNRRERTLPSALTPAQFRKELENAAFHDALRYYADPASGRITTLFTCLKLVLVMQEEKNDYRLPPVLAAELTQDNPDILLLLLRWLDLHVSEAASPPQSLKELGISHKTGKRILGFITALAWFADDKTSAVRPLWARLHRASGNRLANFFSSESMELCLGLKDQGASFVMLPLPDSSHFRKRVKKKDLIHPENGRIDWEKEYGDDNGTSARLLHMTEQWKGTIAEDDDNREQTESRRQRVKLAEAWGRFFDKVWSNRSLILYAQRHFLNDAFRHFDPLLHTTNDMDRPWDIDHIVPYSFGSGRLDTPAHIKEWVNCIGNLRAWPLELNREDQDTLPGEKLSQDHIDEHRESFRIYRMKTADAVLEASFIECGSAEPWHKINWLEGNPKSRFWTNNPEAEHAAPTAIANRFVRIYEEWFDTLELWDIF